jgi:hypothetical protein
MKRIACLLGLFVLVAGAIPDATTSTTTASSLQDQFAPVIAGARLKGKKLFVWGENFSPGDVIVVNGKKYKTQYDDSGPSPTLVARKAGKNIAVGEVVVIQVSGAAGQMSAAYPFFGGRIITFEDTGKRIHLKLGERFLLQLKSDNYSIWTPRVEDPTIIEEVQDTTLPAGAQGIYQAIRIGSTRLDAPGEMPCHHATPPCRAPSLLFEVVLIVE